MNLGVILGAETSVLKLLVVFGLLSAGRTPVLSVGLGISNTVWQPVWQRCMLAGEGLSRSSVNCSVGDASLDASLKK